MEDSWENWLSHSGRNGNSASTMSSLSFEEMVSLDGQYSYSHSSNIMGTKQEQNNYLRTRPEELGSWCSPATALTSEKKHELEGREKRGAKKVRTTSEALHHIMSERKRRREIAEKFIALSATIPGLKKRDKATIIQEAVNYVRQLQHRRGVLEKETNEKIIKSMIITKSRLTSATCEKIYDDEVHLEVEARGLEKEVFIRIHCKKRKGIMLKLSTLLTDIHLSIARCSTLPFGNSYLNITIIAQKSEECTLTVKDLVKILKQRFSEIV